MKIKKFHQINYVLPNEDIEDFSIIRKNIGDIENYNFNELHEKFNYLIETENLSYNS